LIVASDSRLSCGQFWDSNPKIVMLPRSDCVISFAGNTNDAYPLMLQAYNAILMFAEARNRRLDVTELKGHLIRVFNHSRKFISVLPHGQKSPDAPEAIFMLGGYSWRQKRFRIWKFYYDAHIEKFTFRPAGPWKGQGQEEKIIVFVGNEDAIVEAKRRLVVRLREKNRLAQGGLNMEPFEVLRDVIRSEKFPSVGGLPQLVKVYEHMNKAPIGVYWPDRSDGTPTVLGRLLLAYEQSEWGVLDPDSPLLCLRAQGSRLLPADVFDLLGQSKSRLERRI
jgi:hypothetical protein